MNSAEYSAKVKNLTEISKEINRTHIKLFVKHTSEIFGIHRSQYLMLLYISRNENISQKHIAEHFNISPAAVAVTLKKLESCGFISRVAADCDCRRNNVNISEKGMKVVDETRHILGALNRLTFKGFTDEEIDKLTELTKRMYDNLVDAESATFEELKEHLDEAVV